MVHRCGPVCSDLDQYSDRGTAGGLRAASDNHRLVAVPKRNGRRAQFRSPTITYAGSLLEWRRYTSTFESMTFSHPESRFHRPIATATAESVLPKTGSTRLRGARTPDRLRRECELLELLRRCAMPRPLEPEFDQHRQRSP